METINSNIPLIILENEYIIFEHPQHYHSHKRSFILYEFIIVGWPSIISYDFYSLSQIVSSFSLLLTSISKRNMNSCLKFSHIESILTRTVPMILSFYIFKKLRKCSKRNDMNMSFHLFNTMVV